MSHNNNNSQPLDIFSGRHLYSLFPLLFCLGILSCVVHPPFLSLQNEQERLGAIPDSWKDEPVIFLNDSVVITVVVTNGVNTVMHNEVTYVLINRRNPMLLEKIEFMENTGAEKMPKIEATVLYPDGKAWKSTPVDFTSKPYLYKGKYRTAHRVHMLTFPRYVKGMIIRISERRTFHALAHINPEYIRYKYPTLKKTVCLSYPEEYSINYVLSNGEGLDLDTVRRDNEKYRAIWVYAENLKKIQNNNRLRNPEQWYAGLHFSIPSKGTRSYTWREIGDHYLHSIAHVMNSSPEIKKLAVRITRTERDSIITQAFRILQNTIRYLPVFENFHAFYPRPAAEIISTGYGDCKDMATVLKVLLEEKGIKTGLALVTAEGETQSIEAVPTLGNFNHVVLFYENNDGSFRIYDPTMDFGNAANSFYHIAGQKVLLLKKNQSRFTKIPGIPSEKNVITTFSRVKKDNGSGKWRVSGTIDMKGNVAFKLFPLLDKVEGEEKAAFLNEFLQKMFNLKTIEYSIQQFTSDCITIEYTAHFQGNYLTMDKGGFSLDIPSLFGGDVRYTTLDNEGPRFFPDFTQQDTWELPEGFRELESKNLNHWIAKGTWKKKNKQFIREYTRNEVNVPIDKRSEVSDYYNKKLKFIRATVWK